MILLVVAGVATAQQVSSFGQEGADCGAANPIAGTAGASNAVDAVRSNQATYSANAYARRVLEPRFLRGGGGGDGPRFVFHWDHQQTYNVTRVPVVHFEALAADTGCDARFQVATRPVDAWSSNVGLTFTTGRISAFYASSITFAGPVAGDQFIRVGQSLAITPFYALGFAGFVPVWDLATRNPTVYDIGASGLALDWIGGLNANLELVDLSVGYAATQGGYARIAENTVGLFASATFSPNADYGYVAIGGLDRLQLGEAAEVLGLTTLEYLDRPSLSARFGQAPPAIELPDARETSVPRVRWRTSRLAQQNLGGMVDVDAEYRFEPDPFVQRAIVGVHSPWFHPSRSGDLAAEGLQWLVQGGVVDIPAHLALGVHGGLRPTVKGAVAVGFDGGTLAASVMLNDPAQLELFPFDQQLVGYTLTAKGAF